MKYISTLLLIICLTTTTFASDDIPCAASVNGSDIQLEKSPTGMYLIAVEDPHFDQYDVVIDTTNPKTVKLRLARFIATELVPKLHEELLKVSEEMRGEILKLAKARVLDVAVGYDAMGFASAAFSQGEDKISLSCWK